MTAPITRPAVTEAIGNQMIAEHSAWTDGYWTGTVIGGFVVALLCILGCTIVDAIKERKAVNDIKNEAVDRGYAEWVPRGERTYVFKWRSNDDK